MNVFFSLFIFVPSRMTDLINLNSRPDTPETDDGDTFDSEFKMHKANYYMTKMNYVDASRWVLMKTGLRISWDINIRVNTEHNVCYFFASFQCIFHKDVIKKFILCIVSFFSLINCITVSWPLLEYAAVNVVGSVHEIQDLDESIIYVRVFVWCREVLQEQARGYVLAIQWILLYYFEGVPSWSWWEC